MKIGLTEARIQVTINLSLINNNNNSNNSKIYHIFIVICL